MKFFPITIFVYEQALRNVTLLIERKLSLDLLSVCVLVCRGWGCVLWRGSSTKSLPVQVHVLGTVRLSLCTQCKRR